MAIEAGAGGIAGSGGVFEQFAIWGVLMQLTGPILAPIVQAIASRAWSGLPVAPLPPELVADMRLKNWIDEATALVEVAFSGVNKDRFDHMVDNAGEPIALELALQAYRRGFIPWDTGNTADNSMTTAIKTSRVRDQWSAIVKELAVDVIPVGDAVSAVVKGQIPHAFGAEIAYYNGISNDDFTILVNTAGNPPGPGELIELARRGIIPYEGTGPAELTFQQGIYEGMTKDKWWPMYRALAVYLPPPRTITALTRAGVLPPAQAAQLYQQSGLSPELAAIYTADASAVKLSKHKELAEGTVLDLYKSEVIPNAEAAALLGTLGYTSQESAWILQWEDVRRERASIEKAITKTGTLFVARKIGVNTAQTELAALGLPAAQVAQLMTTWALERQTTVKVLTAAEVTDAWSNLIIDQPTAQLALEDLGYTPWDAWLLLSIKNKAALPNEPPPPAQPTGELP